ncbi:DUF3137 domain-containing protein, partial [bacterium]|nr:DUF3137 domain-containing protein [bacterium]
EACIFDFLPIFGDIRWFNKYLPEPLEIDIGLSELYSFVNCKFEDAFTGVYNNVQYTAAETLLTTYVHTKNGRREVEVFRGIILDFPFNKDIKAHTIIEPKLPGTVESATNILIIIAAVVLVALIIFVPGFWHSLWTSEDGIEVLFGTVGVFISAVAAIIGSKKFKKVILEDVVFDKDYSVKSKDQVEARYLITPSFMERFKKLGKAYKSKQIKCALFEEHLMFAISTPKDLFEVGSIYHPLSDTRQIEVFYNEISAIFDIIDEFKLNEKIGL